MGTALQLLQDVLVAVIKVDAINLVARHHDVVNGHLLQVQYIGQHAPVAPGDHGARLGDDGSEFFLGQGLPFLHIRSETQQPEQAVGNAVYGQHEGHEQFEQRYQDEAEGEGQFLRVQCGDGFWGYLGKNQDHQRQHNGCNGDTGVTIEPDGNYGRYGRGQYVDQVVADKNETNQTIRSLQQFAGAPGSFVSAAHQVLQPVAVEREHAGL